MASWIEGASLFFLVFAKNYLQPNRRLSPLITDQSKNKHTNHKFCPQQCVNPSHKNSRTQKSRNLDSASRTCISSFPCKYLQRTQTYIETLYLLMETETGDNGEREREKKKKKRKRNSFELQNSFMRHTHHPCLRKKRQ